MLALALSPNRAGIAESACVRSCYNSGFHLLLTPIAFPLKITRMCVQKGATRLPKQGRDSQRTIPFCPNCVPLTMEPLAAAWRCMPSQPTQGGRGSQSISHSKSRDAIALLPPMESVPVAYMHAESSSKGSRHCSIASTPAAGSCP